MDYHSTPTLWRFHHSSAFVRVIRGPVGSGKSTASCWEIWRKANEQRPGADGIRRTRFAVVRNTYRELKDTTVNTWLDWFDDRRLGEFVASDMEHRIEYGDIRCEILFRALDKPKDVKKVLSLELTAAWLNEVRELPRTIVNRLVERVGRYPAEKDGGCSWSGIIGDTNPPDQDHWLMGLERDPPEDWEFFVQPGGLIQAPDGTYRTNPEAENLDNLPRGYYERNLGGQKANEIRVYRMNLPDMIIDGRPVIPEFDEKLHVRDEIPVLRDQPLEIGADVGGGTLNPSAVFHQRHPRGPRMILAELVCADLGVDRFGEELLQTLAEHFPEHYARLLAGQRDAVILYADPAGEQRDEIFEVAIFDHLRKVCGLTVRGAATQDPDLRQDAIRAPLTRLVDGKPGLLVARRCRKLIRGLAGSWALRRLQVSGRETYASKPDKGEYSHVCEALAYVLVSTGELRKLKGRPEPGRADLGPDTRAAHRERPAPRLGWVV